MRKLLLLFISFFLSVSVCLAYDNVVFKEDNKFGLKNNKGDIIVKPIYKRMILLSEKSYIVQRRSKFGLIDNQGTILVPIKYNQAERILGSYLKIGTGNKFGLYNDEGKEILPIEYSVVDLLFGGMFLTCKDYKYGVIKDTGEVLLDNLYDEIFMPKPSLMQVCYNGKWYEIENKRGENLVLPTDLKSIGETEDLIIKEMISSPLVATGYSVVTGVDYLLKVFSSISPAHEKTIDELMLLRGVDIVSIFVKLSWIPKYPFIYVKNYYQTFKTPNNGPLNEVKYSLKQKL